MALQSVFQASVWLEVPLFDLRKKKNSTVRKHTKIQNAIFSFNAMIQKQHFIIVAEKLELICRLINLLSTLIIFKLPTVIHYEELQRVYTVNYRLAFVLLPTV